MKNQTQHNVTFTRDELAHAFYMMLDYCAKWKPSKTNDQEEKYQNLVQYRNNLTVMRKIGAVADEVGVNIEIGEIEEVAS